MKQKFQPLLFAFLWIIQWPLSAPADETPPPVRALLVTGGCCHDYDTQKDLIAKGLQLRAHIDVTVIRQGDGATDAKIPLYESPDWSKGFDIVIHDECFVGSIRHQLFAINCQPRMTHPSI